MTQGELGDLINTTRQSISNYEKGKREPNYDTLNDLADIFNVDIDYLLGNTDKTTLLPQSIMENYKFTSAKEAMKFMLNQTVVMGFNGLDITKLSEEEQIQYANDMLDMMKLVSLKYKDKK